MRILILGGSGFIGRALSQKLSHEHSVSITTRKVPQEGRIDAIEYLIWDGSDPAQLKLNLKNVDAVINLIGENIAGGRWTSQRKQRIIESRVRVGKVLSDVLPHVPSVKILIQGSACGYYGYWDDMDTAPDCTENTAQGTGFLASTCAAWEQATHSIKENSVRCCILRTAPVLGSGGILQKMLPAYKMWVGGIPGSGDQPFSWIHIDDMVSAIKFLLDNIELKGIYNLSAPNPCTMRDFSTAIGEILHRPIFMPLPGAFLRLLFGEMANETILGGQKAIPLALQNAGFEFKYPGIKRALEMCLKSN